MVGIKATMIKQNTSKGRITNKEIRKLEAIKLDKTDVLLSKVAKGDNIPMGDIRAIVYGTDNVYSVLARKNEMRTINLYVYTYGLDALPCAILSCLFTKYFSDKIIVIENLDSKGNKIRIVANNHCHIDLMTMCMGYREKVRFSVIMNENEFRLFGQALLLLRDWGGTYDIMKECGNDIRLLISKLRLLADSRLMFSRLKPKR